MFLVEAAGNGTLNGAVFEFVAGSIDVVCRGPVVQGYGKQFAGRPFGNEGKLCSIGEKDGAVVAKPVFDMFSIQVFVIAGRFCAAIYRKGAP
ncbi:hypothetical protein EGI32_04260 [Ferruginibacter sp. HRS2-29]|nr:hypothetical protein [Ferruginibacter sp. HRS2-29]